MKTVLNTFLFVSLAMLSTSITMAQKPETNISDSFNYTYQFQKVADIEMAYYEQGDGDPVLFLHGIPDNSYLWRNVIPRVAKNNRAIAVDLAGYGKSGIPKGENYSIDHHYKYLKGFINKLNLTNLTIVVTDIGSLFGLKYALEHESKIKGVVFIEAMYMPSKEWYSSLKTMQKMMFSMMENEKRAYKMIVDKNMMPEMMLKMSVQRKYSDDLKAAYIEPYLNDIERRKVMMFGAGPHTVPNKGITKQKGDFADQLNLIAEGLKKINSNVPFFFIHAKPGMIVRKKNIDYAKKHFSNASFYLIGKGKHYLTEDHPDAIGGQINNWISRIN